MLRNPFASEAYAFRFLLWTLAAFAAITSAAAMAGTVAALAVCALALVIIAAAYLRRGRPARTLPSAPAHLGPPDERRVLLFVDDLPNEAMLRDLRLRADRVLVVSPVRASPLRHWLSDVDQARAQARQRAELTVARLSAAHIEANGVVGDEDPLRALDDALRTFGGDEIVAATSDEALAERLRDRYAIPVTAG